jgi:hypothetical protein
MDVYWFITLDIDAFNYISIGKRAIKHLLERTRSHFTYPTRFIELAFTIPVNKWYFLCTLEIKYYYKSNNILLLFSTLFRTFHGSFA